VNDTNNVGQIYFASANESGQLPDSPTPSPRPVVAIDEANPVYLAAAASDRRHDEPPSVSATILAMTRSATQITLVPEPAIGGLMGLRRKCSRRLPPALPAARNGFS